MSAFVVSKPHIDLLVRAALDYGRRPYQGSKMQWWMVDENGEHDGWRYLDANENSREEYFSPSQLGQILVDENVRSVYHRYPDTDPDAGDLPGPLDAYYMGPYVFTDPGYTLSIVEAFKAIRCLDYQSCEHDGWRKSEAFAFLEAFKDHLIECLDGYDDAQWGFNFVPTRTA